ncbi:MAG: hypothetical protein IT285_13850 [Bdellovibrionales bacterium]|nr:hypothetical protein [Bdellovibrionales bacterium]
MIIRGSALALAVATLLAGVAEARVSRVPLCAGLPPSSNDAIVRGCEFSVRAKEYALRGWYPQAIEKARLAHLLDFSKGEYAQQVTDYAAAFVSFLNDSSFEQVGALFPELDLRDGEDQIAETLARIRERDLSETFDEFQTLLTALVTPMTWEDRDEAGTIAVNAINGEQLERLRLFMDFNLADLKLASSYSLRGEKPQLLCEVLYPLQFLYSSKSVGELMIVANAFPQESGCRVEAYRAIVFQAFTVSGGAMFDSEFRPIFRKCEEPGVPCGNAAFETLSDPAPVLSRVFTDSKLVRAVPDTVFQDYLANSRQDISTEEVNALVQAINGVQVALGVTAAKRIAFYRAASSYATAKASLIYLRIASRFADEVKALEELR